MIQKPSTAFVGASWVALGAGFVGYIVGLWRADMQLNLSKKISLLKTSILNYY
jgi:uncharacterized membrane protein YiaA